MGPRRRKTNSDIVGILDSRKPSVYYAFVYGGRVLRHFAMRICVIVFSFCVALTPVICAHAASSTNDGRTEIARAMEAMGGRARLNAITAIEYVAVGERDMVEQSERPTGPYFRDHFRIHEVRDLVGRRTRVEQTSEAYNGDQWWLQQPQTPATPIVINGDVAVDETAKGPQFAGGSSVQQNEEQFAFAPERLLTTADAATDLRRMPPVRLHGVLHHVFAFTWNGAPCTLFLNADTGLPWRITYTRAYPFHTFLSVWGDVTTSITYNMWTLEPSGVLYPRQWTYERVHLPDMHFAIVQLHLNPSLDGVTLDVPKDIYDAHHGKLRPVDQIPLGAYGSGSPHELAPGITEYPGGWNVVFIKQRDGVVVLEAPWSPAYTQRALDAAVRRYGLPVKAVITTSDSWPHIAGVRQAVADGIRVYALDLNQPILERLIAAPHRMRPDDLQRHPRAARFTFVSTPIIVGDGPNRLVIAPYRTATGERQMMVYFPAHRLLYISDLDRK